MRYSSCREATPSRSPQQGSENRLYHSILRAQCEILRVGHVSDHANLTALRFTPCYHVGGATRTRCVMWGELQHGKTPQDQMEHVVIHKIRQLSSRKLLKRWQCMDKGNETKILSNGRLRGESVEVGTRKVDESESTRLNSKAANCATKIDISPGKRSPWSAKRAKAGKVVFSNVNFVLRQQR